MFEYFGRLLEKGSLSPHGICLLWRPELIWTHVVSDAIIGVAYFSIPVALGVFVTRRRDLAFGWMFWFFALFILACGTTHFFSIWTLWVPDYGAEAVVKAVTAVVSIATAVLLWPLLPRALALPSPAELRRANEALIARIAERDAALDALRMAVAEREQAEAMLRQSQKMEAIGQLTGGVAHDFNNLLTIVIGNLERLGRIRSDDDRVDKAVRNAMSAAERATALVQKMLAFARKQPLVPVRLDPNRLVADLTELLGGALAPTASLHIEPGPDLWTVWVDANQLESVVLNLAVNARDAIPQSGRFTIATRNLPRAEAQLFPQLHEGDYVVLAFSDTGTGMTPEVLERAVDPFFTTKPVGQGTGLGLSQVFGFVKQSGGHVTIESEPGRGTTISLFLPRAAAASQPDDALEKAPSAGAYSGLTASAA